MKTRLLIIIVISIGIVTITPLLMYKTTIFHFEPTMTLEEFHKKFDDKDIVKHFKSVYPDHFAGWGKSPGMVSPVFGYGSVNESVIAELRVEQILDKYEFTYTCGEISEDIFASVMIKNPSSKDIDNNLCW